MDKYPKISGKTKDFPLKSAYAFVKYDGSNIRATWNKKQGFFKFGTRSHLIDTTDPDFGCAIPLVQETYLSGAKLYYGTLYYRTYLK